MGSIPLPQNPGIGGLDELTTSEEFAVQTIAALGTAGQVLRTNLAGNAIEWAAAGASTVEGTAVLSTGEVGGTKYLREDGDGTCSWQSVAGGGDMLLSGIQSVTGLKTFDTTKLAVKGSSTGVTDFASANASATNYTITIPAVTGTLVTGGGTASGTNTGDNATNTQYSSLVTNATHTGEVTGSGALIVDKTAITGKTAVTALGTDYVLISDTSDTGNLKKALISDFAGTGNVSKVGTPVDNQIGVWTGDGTIEGDAGFTFDGGLNITVADAENKNCLTLTQGDVTNELPALKINATGINYPVIIESGNSISTAAFSQYYHNSATPASGDYIGGEDFHGNSSTGIKRPYAYFNAKIVSSTNAAEYGSFVIETSLNGSVVPMLEVGAESDTAINGICVGASTASGVVSSRGDQDIIIRTGNATTGNITIADGANGNITISPNGSGSAVVSATNPTFQVLATDNSKIESYATSDSSYLLIQDNGATNIGPYLELYKNSATPASNDDVGTVYFVGEDSVGNRQNYARVQGIITDTTSTSEDGKIAFGVTTAGTLANELELIGSAIYPTTNNGLDIGTTTNAFNSTFTTALELGHASDTTISRTGAGAIAVEGVAVPTISSTNTLTNKRVTPRILSATSYTTDTGTSLNADNYDIFSVTAQAGALLFNAPGGTPTDGQKLIITVASSTTAARALTWNAIFEASTVSLPSTTAATTAQLNIGFMYSAGRTKWIVLAVA